MTSADVQAQIQYLRPGAERPIYFASRGRADAALRVGADFDVVQVNIANARRLSPPANLEQQGFCLVDHATTISAFYHLEQVRDQYEAEIIALVLQNPEHRWYYFPEQQFEEALLFKTFDSATDGPAQRVAHTAFANPLAPAAAPPRESIESRLLVFFS